MNRRLVAASLIAPLIASVVFVCAASFRIISLKNVAIAFLLYAAGAYLAEAIFGFPALLIYRYFRWQNPVAWGVGGIFLGFLTMLSLSIVYSPFTRSTPIEFVLCMAAGIIAGLSFRFIAGDDFQNRTRVH
jgi:hypothetical protein